MARSGKKPMNKGAWTAEEDRKLAHYIHLDGPRRWRTLALKAGLDRCGKSCRLRWLNYLRPNIKRGNISDDEEDLILRLHKLLGNRWSLIAGRLPGRTDNEIKNYWHSHLSKKSKSRHNRQETTSSSPPNSIPRSEESNTNTKTIDTQETKMEINDITNRDTNITNFDDGYFFDFSDEGTLGLEWVAKFLELDEDQ